jgi:hypothetical protein
MDNDSEGGGTRAAKDPRAEPSFLIDIAPI